MRLPAKSSERANALVCALCVISIMSLIGADVLYNCTTRYNATSKQVKGWKESLYAAEAAADVGYAECRKYVLDPSNQWSGWGSGPVYTKTIPPFGESNSLSGTVTIDQLPHLASDSSTYPYYRIRAVGTAALLGLRRTGMDDRVGLTTRGDSLLRKIDFSWSHFQAAYGDGDGNGKAQTAVGQAQISRRVELVAVPIEPFEGALKVLGSFAGPGSAGQIDSYDSKNGAYPGKSVATTPTSPYYADSRDGNVEVNTPNFQEGGPIYGDVGTNGGTVTHSNTQISGTIDNTVSFTAPPVKQPSLPLALLRSGQPATITPTATASNAATPDWYLYSGGYSSLTINALLVGGNPVETYVTIVATGDIGDITIAKGVNAKIYFTGDLNAKASRLINNNVDGAGNGVYQADGVTPSTNYSRAAHLQFNGITPTTGTQSINIAPPGNLWATFYAPSANMSITGNPDVYGSIVCGNFSGNGNTGFHFDKRVQGNAGPPVNYRIASYIEDVR
jgi:hypothetical protein